MDLGIAGRWAIVCASSQGLGHACAQALAAEGVNVVVNGRSKDRLDQAAERLRRQASSEVVAVAADITTPDGRQRLLDSCEPDILVTNNAGPRPGTLSEISDDDIAWALQLHYWAPISLVRAVVPHMRAQRFGRIVNITSAMVTTPRPFMTASTGARAGMTAVMKALSFETVRDNVTINQLLPERIDSPRQVQVAEHEMRTENISFEEARRRQAESIAAKRHGRPEELGATCAFLCSAHAGFVCGMNLHLDGGSYPGLV